MCRLRSTDPEVLSQKCRVSRAESDVSGEALGFEHRSRHRPVVGKKS